MPVSFHTNKYKLNMPKVAAFIGLPTLSLAKFNLLSQMVVDAAIYKGPTPGLAGSTMYVAPSAKGYLVTIVFAKPNKDGTNGVTLFGIDQGYPGSPAGTKAHMLKFAAKKGLKAC